MLTFESRMTLTGVTGDDITAFMLECEDARYRSWWPGTHLAFHIVRPGPGHDHVGDVVWMDEFVGSRRLRMPADVVEAVPGERIVWHLRPWRLRLPVILTLEVRPDDAGVLLRHVLTAGWRGRLCVFDPLWRLYFTRSFARELDEHAHTEFPKLTDLLHRGAA